MDPHPAAAAAAAATMVKSFKYSSTQQQPMFGVLETPLHYRSDPHKNQDASFSSYLKSSDQKSQEKILAGVDDTEISIFDAQRYFSEVNSDPKEMMKKHDVSSVSSTEGYGGRNFRTRSFRATPTASSEASWNSQTGLLANPPGALGVSIRNLDAKRERKWSFGRKCCCTGKKSVEVKDATTSDSEHASASASAPAKRDAFKSKRTCSITDLEITQQKIRAGPNSFPSPNPPPRQQRISASGRPFVDGFSFPVLNNATQPAKPALKPIITKSIINIPLEDPPRDSLEVFQPPPPRFTPGPGSPGARDDDVVSDASSDLFEIESFSTQTTSYPTYRRRDSLDEAPTFNARRFANANANIQYGRRSVDEPPTPSVAGTECYAPSEVSIDWSVTTAEGFDRASVSNFSVSASEVGLLRHQEDCAKKKGNGGGLLLMSCRQEKAVSVGPHPVKCVAAADSAGAAGRPPRAGKPPLASDHSARLSVAFAA